MLTTPDAQTGKTQLERCSRHTESCHLDTQDTTQALYTAEDAFTQDMGTNSGRSIAGYMQEA